MVKFISDIKWKPWRFAQVNSGFWDDETNLTEYFHWLEEKLCIMEPEDWFDVGKEVLAKFRGESEVVRAHTLILLHFAFLVRMRRPVPNFRQEQGRLLSQQCLASFFAQQISKSFLEWKTAFLVLCFENAEVSVSIGEEVVDADGGGGWRFSIQQHE